MKYCKWFGIVGFVVILGSILSGCSTVGIKVPVTRPAEINLRGKSEIIIGEVSGRGGAEIADYLKEKVIESGRFKLIDRQHLNRVLGELKLSTSDLADSEKQKQLGKLMTGSILVVGRVSQYKYGEDMKKEKSTCTRGSGKKTVKYTCYHYQRTGVATVKTSFSVIDIQTGQNLKAKTIKFEESDLTTATDEYPAEIDKDSLLDICKKKVATNFMKAIAPYKEYVVANFQKDGDLPMLEIGINYARTGQWEDATSQFQSAVQQAGGNADISPSTAAKAHWDLGLAYEYTYRFDEAITEIKKAYQLSGDADYLKEVSNVKRLRKEQQKLKEQMGSGTTGS